MDRNIAIKVDHVSKKFSKQLKRSMWYGVKDISRNMVGLSSKSDKLRKSEFWAVNDVSFKLKKGEALGLIGPNGSGKTTLLKMLNGIFWPDKGKITIDGKVGALISVGAGFHPMLSGRENIYLNGSIYGLSKNEIDSKLDDIIEFADIGDFIDSPVKFYSSGMIVRLGFSIAVHCEPDILLIDEVLAVGDISFKRKCMDRINEIRKQTSTIFISHSMHQVERICDRAMLLNEGKLLKQGQTDLVINEYYNLIGKKEIVDGISLNIVHRTEDITNIQFDLMNQQEKVQTFFKSGESILVRFRFSSRRNYEKPHINFTLNNGEGIVIGGVKSSHHKELNELTIRKGDNEYLTKIKKIPLLKGKYRFRIKVKRNDNLLLMEAYSPNFAIISDEETVKHNGIVKLESQWIKNK